MEITREEFDVMLKELLGGEKANFNMLCSVAEKLLMPSIKRWCNADPALRGRDQERDIMNTIHLHLINVAITGFFLKEGPGGPVNDDPEGFKKWLFTVACNKKRDIAKGLRKNDYYVTDLDNPLAENLSTEDDDNVKEAIYTLKWAYGQVWSSNYSIYIVLTWMAVFVLILESDISKIKATHHISESMSDKTLYDFYEIILRSSRAIPWMELSAAQDRKILAALEKPYKDGLVYGEAKYSEFYMKKGPEKSISDWINKINNMLRRRWDDESSNG